MAAFRKILFPLLITSALASQDGVCVKTWKSVKTVRESYVFTWYHTYYGYCDWDRCRKRQLKSRIEYRIKYYDVPHQLEICCNGYEKTSSDPLVCQPRCTPKCVFANCTGPGICTCFSGHKAVSSHECEPICDPECVMGKCVDHNICDCLQNYKKSSNASHVCEPICSKQCQNSYCDKPEECHCYDGYKPDEKDKYNCLPHCDNCVNGVCVQPDKCECHEGYQKENETCVPFCSRECVNGYCSGPEQCTCNPDYLASGRDWNVCVPVCSECLNSYCSEPNICTCYEGFAKETNTSCVPVCSPQCENGECIEPDVCHCLDGYKPVTNNTCEPDCSNDCINGKCTEPGKCTCLDGYKFSEYTNICEPICENGCHNGNCISPNNCTCGELVQIKPNVCMPICNESCESNFSNCEHIPECVQISKHFFSKNLLFTTNNALINLQNAIMTLNWSCSDIFKNLSTNCPFSSCEDCPSLPLRCISEINLEDKHVDFICTKLEEIEDYFGITNETEFLINYSEETFNYSITLIHPEELHGAQPGKCDICMCGTNLKGLHKHNEAQFYFTPCQKRKESLQAEKILQYTFDYQYIIIAITLVVAAVIVAAIVFQIRKQSSSYGVRREQDEEQELKLEEEFLVNLNNIHEDD